MAIPTVLYGEMFKAMKDLAILMSVKKIFGPHGKHLTTWDEVDAWMQQQQASYKYKRFITKVRAATRLLQKIREFYLANEAQKARDK